MKNISTPIISIIDNDIGIHGSVDSALAIIDGEEWLLDEGLKIYDSNGMELKYRSSNGGYHIEYTHEDCKQYVIEKIQFTLNLIKKNRGLVEFEIPNTLPLLIKLLEKLEKKHKESSFSHKLKSFWNKITDQKE